MRHWKFVGAGVAANVLILVSCLITLGWNHAAGGAAARNTARFAVVLFLAAFAAPGIQHWLRSFPAANPLVSAYVAAQMVHYAAVALLHTALVTQLEPIGPPQIAIGLAGFSLTVLMGITASARRPPLLLLHKSTLYLTFLILAADYSAHPVRSMRLTAIPVFAALVLRHLPLRKRTSGSTAAAGS